MISIVYPLSIFTKEIDKEKSSWFRWKQMRSARRPAGPDRRDRWSEGWSVIRINLNGHRDRDGGPTRTLLTRLLTRSYILERINRLSGSCKVGYATRRLGCCFSYCDLHWQELFSSVFKQLSATGLFKLIRICSNIPPSLAFQIQFWFIILDQTLPDFVCWVWYGVRCYWVRFVWSVIITLRVLLLGFTR